MPQIYGRLQFGASLNILCILWCFFCCECGKIGHFGWPDLGFSTSKSKTCPQHTKHNTHNNQNELPPPYPPLAMPSLSMGRLLAPPTNGTAAPYGPMQGTRGRVWRQDSWFACLGGKIKMHQKKRWMKVYWA